MKQETKLTLGVHYAVMNPLTDKWQVFDTIGHQSYVSDKNGAFQLLATIDHYHKTGETKAFSLKDAKAIVKEEPCLTQLK